ncbi:MAG: tRNA epoxyqueuosine(34) reductase QueG [Cellvibrionaceae bacterium]
MSEHHRYNKTDLNSLALQIKSWGKELGFQQVGITDTELQPHEAHLEEWLEKGYHGTMSWMSDHGKKRSRPRELLPSTVRVISVRLDYLPGDTTQTQLLQKKEKAYLARYALGRDYHKLIRKRLKILSDKISSEISNNTEFENFRAPNQRPFVDSAPVLERALAEKAHLGWIGKNTMLINNKAGSWFFLGEIFTSLPLPCEPEPSSNHCGTCHACLDVCPTQAFVNPYELDARKCISYLTIEHKGAIPEELRKPMGNRIFGCDDCQLVCPWNKFAKPTDEKDFKPRHQLDSPELLDLFNWTEEEFLKRTEGSPIRRIGYQNWLRNISVALGNAPTSKALIAALKSRQSSAQFINIDFLQEHFDWALEQHQR